MPLNIKNPDVERLVDEVVAITGESKTEAVRKALLERRTRLQEGVRIGRRERWLAFLEREVWPDVPGDVLGTGVPQAEQDAILGYDDPEPRE